MSLVILKGSRKQIDYASDIRAKKLAEIEELLKSWQRKLDDLRRNPYAKSEQLEEEIQRMRAALDADHWFRRQSSCRWWIDNKDVSGKELLRLKIEEILETGAPT